MGNLQNVLVTGTSSGFGRLIAATLASRGHTVVATMRDPAGRNAEVARELGRLSDSLHVLELDVTSDASVHDAVATAETITGGLDVVVNNAGIGAGGHAEAFTPAQLAGILDINVVGVQRVTRATLPFLRQRGRGLLLSVSSIMGRIVIPWSAPYTASKFALEGLMESYRIELTGTGVEVAIVEPGGFATDFASRMLGPDDTERVASYGERAGEPQRLWGGFMEALAKDGPDPQLVADAVAETVDAPAGQRAFRVVVDPMMGGGAATAVNETTEAVQAQLMKQLGGGSDQAEA